MFDLSRLMWTQSNTPTDSVARESFDWLRKAAEAGHPTAQVNLAYVHVNEAYGHKKNPKFCSDLLRKAAMRSQNGASQLIVENGVELFTLGRGVLSPICAENTEQEERANRITRFRHGDWGQMRAEAWKANDRALDQNGTIFGRYNLDPERTLVIQKSLNDTSYFIHLEGEPEMGRSYLEWKLAHFLP
jgi:hypothetical protein